MYDFLVKRGTTVSFIVGLLVIVIFLGSALSGLGAAGYDMSTDLVAQGKEAMKDMNFFNAGLKLTLALIFIAVIAMLVFGLVGLAKFPKAGMKSIATFAGLIIVFFILKGIAPEDSTAKMVELKERFSVSDGTSGMIGGGIMTTLCLIGFAAVSMIVFEIRNAFK